MNEAVERKMVSIIGFLVAGIILGMMLITLVDHVGASVINARDTMREESK